MKYLTEEFIGEQVDCEDFGIGTIVEVTNSKIVLAFNDGLVDIDIDDIEMVDEGYDPEPEDIAKMLVQKHGKNVTKDHIDSMDRDSRGSLDHEEIMKHVKKLTEEIELDEARGRPPKAPAPGKKPSAAWVRHLERKDKGEDKEELEALGAQLRKSVSINKPVTFLNGEKKTVDPRHISKFEDHMAARPRTIDKQKFQNDAHASHDAFVKAVTSTVPKPEGGTSSIVKYR